MVNTPLGFRIIKWLKVKVVDAVPVSYPEVFSGCTETPLAIILLFKSELTPLLAPTFTCHLNLRLLETPLRPALDTPLSAAYEMLIP